MGDIPATDMWQVIDPDPFSVALGIVGAVAGTASWLETRRQRQGDETRLRREFRAAWFACRRSIEFLSHSIEEFSLFVEEKDIRRAPFRFGAVRIGFETMRDKETFARLSRQIDAFFVGSIESGQTPVVVHSWA